jgi:hypothetical protein
MIKKFWKYAVQTVLLVAGIAGLLLVYNCGDTATKDVSVQDSTASVEGKAIGPAKAPKKALFGQYFKDPATGRTWIFDGANWVPHDSTIDDYYKQLAAVNSKILMSMTQDEVRTAPCTTADGTGAHPKHAGLSCKVCHMVGGVMCFDPAGPATGTGIPAPTFNATAKTCSNIACHSVKAGTFSYYYPGNDIDPDGYPIPDLKTVNYGGGAPQPTPSWYVPSGSAGCTACHGNPPYPPLPASDGSNNWHSGFHANNQNVGPIGPNACELCHNDTSVPYGTWTPIAFSAVGTDGKVHGISINPAAAAQHANGTATVLARFRSQCFNCH